MTDFLKHQLEVYFIENPDDAMKIITQILINKRRGCLPRTHVLMYIQIIAQIHSYALKLATA